MDSIREVIIKGNLSQLYQHGCQKDYVFNMHPHQERCGKLHGWAKGQGLLDLMLMQHKRGHNNNTYSYDKAIMLASITLRIMLYIYSNNKRILGKYSAFLLCNSLNKGD